MSTIQEHLELLRDVREKQGASSNHFYMQAGIFLHAHLDEVSDLLLAASHIPETEVVAEIVAWQSMDTALMDGTPLMLFARAENATASVPVIGWYLEGEGWIAQTFAPNVPTKIVPSAWQPRPGFPTRSETG